jgi:hypothetical protein
VSVLLEEEYIYAVQVLIPSTHTSMIIVNIYAPVHSPGFSSEILKTIKTQLELIIAQSPPTTTIVVAGTNP